MEVNDIIESVCVFSAKHFYINENELYGSSQKAEIVIARQMAIYMLHVNYGISSGVIAKTFFKTRRWVFKSIQKIQDGIKTQQFYRAVYSNFMEAYKKETGI